MGTASRQIKERSTVSPPKKSGPPRRPGSGGAQRSGGDDARRGDERNGAARGGRRGAPEQASARAAGGARSGPARQDRTDARPATDQRAATGRAGPAGEPQGRAAPTRREGRDGAARPAFGRRPEASAPRPPRPRATGKPAAGRPANPHPARAAADGKGEPQRVAKLLARAGVASRREIERMIEEGRIAKDGVPLDTPATLLTSLHGVTVDGVAVAAPAPARLFLFHKPTGCLTTERDPAGRPTIYDRLPDGLPRLMPIGRLDMNTEGLLLLTTDGGFKREMELPATGVPRTYRARAFGEVSQQQLEDLFDGLEIDGIRYGRIEANLERRTGRNQWVEMTLTEGKNREVRRVLEHLGLKVNRLIRTAYGPFTLGEMPVGAVEEVRQHDLVQFRNTLGKALRS
jgi:23S rRNA pseudouridine2605 synthase